MIRRFRAEVAGHRGRRGFTLLELLVATAVASLLLVLLFSIIAETMGVSRRTVHSLIAANSASTAMDVIAADLAGLMPLEGDAEYLFVGQEVVAGVTNAYLRFLSASPNNRTADDDEADDDEPPRDGQPGFVTYRVAQYDVENLTVSASNPAYALFRRTLSGSDTFDLMGEASIGSMGTLPAMDDFLANNVVEFQVQPLRDGEPVGEINELGLKGNAPSGNDRPDALLLMMTTLDDEGAQKLRDGMDLEDAKLKHGRVLTRRVHLTEGFLP